MDHCLMTNREAKVNECRDDLQAILAAWNLPHEICMLPDGHEGPHAFTREDDAIPVLEPECRAALLSLPVDFHLDETGPNGPTHLLLEKAKQDLTEMESGNTLPDGYPFVPPPPGTPF